MLQCDLRLERPVSQRAFDNRKRSCPKMPDPRKILGALDALTNEWGEDLDHFVNMDRVLKSKAVIGELRANTERRISEWYRPGFRFEDDYHAAWFLKNWYPWRQMTFGGEIPPEKYDDTWVRIIFVPDRYHYLAEVAYCLQKYDRYTEEQIRTFQRIKKQGSERDVARASKFIHLVRSLRALPPGPLKGERDRMAMKSWHKRIGEKFKKFIPPEQPTSLARLARSAKSYRESRREGTPANGWQITNVHFLGTIENPTAKDPKKWNEFTHDYSEHWTWKSIDGVPDPKRTRISFQEPVDSSMWGRKWKKNQIPFRD